MLVIYSLCIQAPFTISTPYHWFYSRTNHLKLKYRQNLLFKFEGEAAHYTHDMMFQKRSRFTCTKQWVYTLHYFFSKIWNIPCFERIRANLTKREGPREPRSCTIHAGFLCTARLTASVFQNTTRWLCKLWALKLSFFYTAPDKRVLIQKH